MYKYLTIEFPLAQLPPQRVFSFVLYQHRYRHEIATITLRDWDVKYANIKPGAPVKCKLIGQGPPRDFVGYIHDINPEFTPGTRTTRLTVIGASYRMKQEKQRIFSNVTATDVVKRIAKEYGFKADVDEHPRVYPQISQPGISDFQLIARLAQQCGYTMFIDNTTIKFKNVTTDYNKNRLNAEKFTVRDANDPAGSTLYSFNLTLGESVRYSDAYKAAVRVSGVDPVNKVISSITNQDRNTTLRKLSNTEIFDNYATDTVAPTPDAAYYEALSADERNRFPYRANIQVIGAPSLTPGMPIYLEGLQATYDGYWVVLSCEHHINQSDNNNVFKYTCFVEVGIDSLRGANKLNNVDIEKPSVIKKRAIVHGVKNGPTTNSSKLTVGNDKNTNYISSITTRKKGSEYDNKTGHFWIFDGQTTSEYVTKKTKSNLSIIRKGR